jgi:hypothetical protein
MKHALFSFAVLGCIFSNTTFAEKAEVGPVDGTVEIMASLNSCNRTEPRGYLWTGGTYNTGCISVSGNNWAYVFTSYFDRPIGAQMVVCSDESVFPDGWFVVSHVQFSGCVDGRHLIPVIQRYF